MSIERELLDEIELFCQQGGIAESTFGKRAVNDGKFVARLRAGKSTTAATIDRVRTYMTVNQAPDGAAGNGAARPASPSSALRSSAPFASVPLSAPLAAHGPDTSRDAGPGVRPGGGDGRAGPAAATGKTAGKTSGEDGTHFRFYDNRQKYLMFVNTCGEKWRVAERVGMELQHIRPSPPAMRVFDAGMGDGSVLTNVMRQMHRRFPTVPFYIAGKEISLEDVRLSLEKMPDRFHEHPATVLVVTNLYYTEAPWLTPRSMQAAATLNWIDVPLRGDTAFEFHEQIAGMQDVLSENWQVRSSPKTGNPLYVRPSVMVIYREDHRFLLDQIIPRPGRATADYDLVIASQPYRARMPTEFKVQKVVAPLARSLAPGGRMLGIHSAGGDPGLEIIRRVWPNEDPFKTTRHDILRVLKQELGRSNRDLNFGALSDKRSIFRYDMHTLPSEISDTAGIGTSTLMAAWNAAVYVAQIEDERLEQVMTDSRYLEVTRDVLQKYGGLWFNDESYVITRRRA